MQYKEKNPKNAENKQIIVSFSYFGFTKIKVCIFLGLLYFGAIPIPYENVPPHPMGGRTLLLPSSRLFFKDAWQCGRADVPENVG